MIDMHLHTIHSDGIKSVEEILKMAQDKKLDYIAITDHDSVDAYKVLKNINIKDYFSGKIIVGCELKFDYKGISMELVALGLDYDKIKLSPWVQKELYHKIKKALLKSCLEKAKLLGFVYNKIEYNPEIKPERMFYKELISHNENICLLKKFDINHSGEFFRKLIANPQSKMYFDCSSLTLNFEDACNLIHSCGGFAFLAHPFGVYDIKDTKPIINELIATGKLDGLECMHANITDEQSKYLFDLCKTHNLLTTGGSDFHGYEGQFFSLTNVGKNQIPTDVINGLLSKINKSAILN